MSLGYYQQACKVEDTLISQFRYVRIETVYLPSLHCSRLAKMSGARSRDTVSNIRGKPVT